MTLSWHKQALAARYASSCVSLNDHRKIILAVGRSKVMISKINSPEAGRSPMSIVIRDIKKMSKFLTVSFLHVCRRCNQATHAPTRSPVHGLNVAWVSEARLPPASTF